MLMKDKIKIKVCGMRNPGNIRDVAELRPDFMGFIFYPRSSRYCGDLSPTMVKSLPAGVTPVAVSVDMEEGELEALVKKYGFPVVQLHGHESPQKCRSYYEDGLRVWKAISLNDREDLERLEEYAGSVEAFLFDTPTAGYGGSGMKFNWGMLMDYHLPVPFILSGGLSADDVPALKAFSHPMMMGIDVNSRFETAPAMKDVALLKSFMAEFKV